MMIRSALVLLALAVPAAAQETCERTAEGESCVRVLACFGDTGRWFDGRAIGRGAGTVSGTTDDGVACEGTFDSSEDSDYFGTADFTCEDGLTGQVTYHTTDPETGTALGEGVAEDGTSIQVWTGEYVLEYLRRGTGEVARLPCMADGEVLAGLAR